MLVEVDGRIDQVGLEQHFERNDVIPYLGAHAVVQPFQAQLGDDGRHAAVNEGGIIDDNHERLLEEPLAILAVAAEGTAVCVKARRARAIELCSEQFLVQLALDLHTTRGEQNVEPALSLLGRFLVGERGILASGYIAQVADQVHDLVITERQQYLAPFLRRLCLELHHEIHDPARIGPAIEQVAGYDQRCIAPRPVAVTVDNARIRQRPQHRVVRTVGVTHRNDTTSALVPVFLGDRRRGEGCDRKPGRDPDDASQGHFSNVLRGLNSVDDCRTKFCML